MFKIHRLLAAALLLGAVSSSLAAFPDHGIRLVVPYPPGSGTDTVARYTGRRLEATLGIPVIIDNRPGGNAIIATQAVINSRADGYTLLWAANGPVATNVALYEKLTYDPLTDLVPVARTAFSPMGLFVPFDSPHSSATDLLTFTKTHPDKLNYASGSATYHVATEWLLSLAGGHASEIPYKGAAPAIVDLAGHQVDFAIVEMSAALPLVRANKLKLLAVTSDRRLPSEPNIPTLQELGFASYFEVAWWAVFAPKGTPASVVSTIEKALLGIYADAESKKYLDDNNFSPFIGNAPTLRQYQEAEIKRDSELVNRFKIPKL